jgi:hypothetical protein
MGALFLAVLVGVQDWTPLDARSASLGGAGVAFAEGGDGAYWNPASMAAGGTGPFDFTTGFGFSLSTTAGYALAGGVAGDVAHLVDLYEALEFQDLQDSINAGFQPSAGDVQNLMRIVDAMSHLEGPGKGGVVTAGLGLTVRVGPLAFFARGVGQAGADPYAQLGSLGALSSGTLSDFFSGMTAAPALSPAGTALSAQLQAAGLVGSSDPDGVPDADELAFQAQLALGDAAISDPAFQQALAASVAAMVAGAAPGDTLYYSDVGVIVRGFAQLEAGVSLGLPVIPTIFEAGLSLKEVVTETLYRRITVSERDLGESGGQDLADAVRDDLRESRRRTSRFNVDLGARVTPLPWLAASIAARNILPMRVDVAGPEGHLDLDPQVRAALLFAPLARLRAGVDLDLVETESPVLPGYEFRQLAAGAELDLWSVNLRAGYVDNLATSESDGALTAGLGLDILGVKLDVAARYGLKRTQVVRDGELDRSELDLPQQVTLAMTLGVEVSF